MKRVTIALILLTVLTVAWGDPPHDSISLDRPSPSVVTFGNTPADIYYEMGPEDSTTGWDDGGGGPMLHVPQSDYGLGLGDNTDAHSNGALDSPAELYGIYFSADATSVGAPATDYEHQALLGQAAGDRFVANGLTMLSPMDVMSGLGPATIDGPILPGGLGDFPMNVLSANQTWYNQIPSIPPGVANSYLPSPGSSETVMDDMDALELTVFDVDGDGVHDLPIFFSMDAASPSLSPYSPADILVSPPGATSWAPFAVATFLGLTTADDVDALVIWDFEDEMVMNFGVDYALFSLAPGSPFLLGPDGLADTPDDFSPADIFVTDFSADNELYLSHESLGMLFTDNIDALDVELLGIQIFNDVTDGAEPEFTPGDANGDGLVDLQDFSLLKANFGTTIGATWGDGDFNGDGAVGLQDFSLLKANFGTSGAGQNIPEPATLSLLAVAGITLLRQRTSRKSI